MSSPKVTESNAKRRAALEEYAREEAGKPQYERVVLAGSWLMTHYMLLLALPEEAEDGCTA